MPFVDKIVPITESYKLTNKKFHPQPSRIKVGNSDWSRYAYRSIGRSLRSGNRGTAYGNSRAIKKAAQFVPGQSTSQELLPTLSRDLKREGSVIWKKQKKKPDWLRSCEVISEAAIEAAAKYVDMNPVGTTTCRIFSFA